MNSNYQQNSFRNFNSDYFQLIPSKFITFAANPVNPSKSELLESLSNRNENSIFFRYSQLNQNNNLEFDNSEKSF